MIPALLEYPLNPSHKLVQLGLQCEVPRTRVSPDFAKETASKLKAEARRPWPMHLMVLDPESEILSLNPACQLLAM